MQPISPRVPGYEDREVVFAKDQPEYVPLPALPIITTEGRAVLTRWTFTDEERNLIASGADLFVKVLTFGGPLQPVAFSVSGCLWEEIDGEGNRQHVGIMQGVPEPS